ncbi:MAG: AIR synthase family protein [Sphingomonadaceae bacterium]
METGKLSPSDLERIVFPYLGVRRPDVLVRAAVGEDSAIIDFGDWVCVLSTDPITGATKNAGWLAVHVSCNDVASNGAEPVGVLLTLLLSEQAGEEDLRAVMEDAHRAASELGIEVLGGHTEVTPGLPATIVSSTAVGKAPKSRYVVSSGARPGDALVLTKSAGLEGTAILATDFEDRLWGFLGPEQLVRAQSFRWQISVVQEGLAAAELGATAMHDATEGGVLGAIHEMVTSAGVGVEVWADAVPVREETRAICRFFHADPLKLISSGTLLIACPDGTAMAEVLTRRGVPAAVIGRLTDPASGRWVICGDRRLPLEPSYRDELWRILESGRGSE